MENINSRGWMSEMLMARAEETNRKIAEENKKQNISVTEKFNENNFDVDNFNAIFDIKSDQNSLLPGQ